MYMKKILLKEIKCTILVYVCEKFFHSILFHIRIQIRIRSGTDWIRIHNADSK
jgi:hypothetical protein